MAEKKNFHSFYNRYANIKTTINHKNVVHLLYVVLLMGIERFDMKKDGKSKPLEFINLFLVFTSLLLLISIIFPTYSIFGYKHEVLSSFNSNLSITISEQPLFHVLSDDYYAMSLKIGYISLFAVERLSVLCCLVLLLFLAFRKRRQAIWMVTICYLLTLMLCVLVIPFFFTNPLILAISSFLLFILIGNVVFQMILKFKKKRKEN